MGEHTPTPGPWTVSKSPDDMIVCDSEGGSIADCAPPGPWMTLAEARANAAFIVKACNSYDALVKALRPFIEALPGHEHAKLIDKRYGDFNPIQATVTKAQMQAAREALAKVQS